MKKNTFLITFYILTLSLLQPISSNAVEKNRLLEAIESEDKSAVQNILNKGINLSIIPEGKHFGYLTSAVIKGNIEIVKDLISHGAEINPACEKNIICKPIIWAAENGDIEMLDLLINKGADVNSVGPYKFSVLKYAIDKKQSNSIAVLLKNGADINQRDQFSISNFELAITKCPFGIIELMMEYSPDINANNFPEKFTPLMMASKIGRFNVVKYLIEKGANPNIKTKSGHTALDYAIYNKHDEVIAYLESIMGKN